MVGSKFAPEENNPFVAFNIFSKASVLQENDAKLELMDQYFPIIAGEIRSLLTSTSQMPKNDNFLRSCACGSRAVSPFPESGLTKLKFCDNCRATLFSVST